MPPTQLLASLDSLRRRARSISVLYGLAVLLLVACAMLFGGALVDYLLRLPGVPRLLGLLAAFAALAYLGYRYVYKPAVARLSLGDVAGRVEEAFPQFEDRLRSSVQFLGEGRDSDPLRRRAVEQAGDIARGVDFEDVLVTRPAYLTAAGAVGAIAVLTLLGVLLGPLAGVIAGRLFDPLNDQHQWPKAYEIAPLSLANRVPAGQSVPVTMSLTKGKGEAVEPVVYYALDDGQPRQLLMTRQTDGTFSASVDTRLAAGAASGSLKVWVEAGDDQTKPQIVQVVPRLAVTGITAEVTPPPYVPGGKPQTLDLANGPVVTAARLGPRHGEFLQQRDGGRVLESHCRRHGHTLGEGLRNPVCGAAGRASRVKSANPRGLAGRRPARRIRRCPAYRARNPNPAPGSRVYNGRQGFPPSRRAAPRGPAVSAPLT